MKIQRLLNRFLVPVACGAIAAAIVLIPNEVCASTTGSVSKGFEGMSAFRTYTDGIMKNAFPVTCYSSAVVSATIAIFRAMFSNFSHLTKFLGVTVASAVLPTFIEATFGSAMLLP